MNNGKHGQGTHCTKMGADCLAKNTPKSQNLSAQFVCPSPKVQDFNEKGFIGRPLSVTLVIQLVFLTDVCNQFEREKTSTQQWPFFHISTFKKVEYL